MPALIVRGVRRSCQRQLTAYPFICKNTTVPMPCRLSLVRSLLAGLASGFAGVTGVARIGAVVAVSIALGLCGVARADDVPPDRQALILTRTLAYDNNLRSRAGDAVVVAVIFKRGNAASEAAAGPILQGFRALEGVKVQDLPFHAVQLAYANAAGLKSSIESQGIDVLYICPGLDSEIGAIKEISHHAHVLTIGAKEEFVKSGLSLGVFVVDAKNTITVNLPATHDEGAAFAAELLRIGRVIR
jgi:hypothetical protein